METLQTSSGSITKSEAEGSTPKGAGPLSFSIEKTASVPEPIELKSFERYVLRAVL